MGNGTGFTEKDEIESDYKLLQDPSAKPNDASNSK
jgi:hypothetical protein